MTTETHVENGTLTVRRIYDAPQAEVFDAWIDAAKTTHWWGCGQTERVASRIEPRVGGAYYHLMSLRDVGDHPIDGTITEFDPPRALAYTMPGMESGEVMAVRVTFEPAEAGTRVTLTQSKLDETLKDVVAAGWAASFERLADFFQGARRAA